MSRIGPNLVKNNLNDLKKLNTSSMTNGSSEFIHINKKDVDRSLIPNRTSESPIDDINQNWKNNIDPLKMTNGKESNMIKPQEVEIKTSDIVIKSKEETEDISKKGKKNKDKPKQVIFDSEKDKVIVVDNWKKYNVEKNKCKCNLI